MPSHKPKLVRVTTVPISFLKLLSGQLEFMQNYFEVIAVSSNNYLLEEVGKKEGVRTFCIEMTRKITPIQDLIAFWKMYKFLKSERPDIIHTHTPKAGTIGMLAAFFAGVPKKYHTVAGLPLLESRGIKRILLTTVKK